MPFNKQKQANDNLKSTSRDPFPDNPYGFPFSRSTADVLGNY